MKPTHSACSHLAATLGLMLWLLAQQPVARARGARAPWDVSGGLLDEAVAAAQEPATPCSCECCQVGRRTPSEMSIGATQLKCIAATDTATKETGGLTCPASCSLGLRAKVMTNIESETVLYSQYCFLECRPFDVKIGSQCIGITTAEADEAATADGTGQDIHVIPVVQQPPTVPPPLPPPLADQLLDGLGEGGASMSAPPIPPAVPPPSPAEESLKEGDDAMDAADAMQDQLNAQAEAAKGHGDEAEENAIAAQDELKEGFPKALLLAGWRRSRRGFLPGPRVLA